MNVPKQIHPNQTPPFWYPFDGGDGKIVNVLVCDKNHHSRLSGPHKIDAQGNVAPSCVCGEPDCGFHAMVTLLGFGS